MIYYKAFCKLHGWESDGLYSTRFAAVESSDPHRRYTSPPHDITVLQVYIPDSGIEFRSEEII